MSPDTCNRVRDALAAGNVFGDAALLEHAKDCDVCASELAVLKKRRDFRDAFPVLSSIADESKRAPTSARASAHPANLGASRRHLLIMIAALIAIVGFLFRTRTPAAPPQDEAATVHPKFRISNLENALFESKVEGGTVRSSLTRGVAAFHVERLGPRQRFLLTLPDGDLEVRGTRFVVIIEGGKTKQVDVAEGSVALRLHGRAEMLLSAGERWPSAESGRPTLSFMQPPPPKDAAPPEPSEPND
jgi:ferric-dicitrate binding protein FerR (iron transport regulator)